MLKILISLLLFTHLLYAKKYDDDPQWLALLHIKNNISEIQDEHFFLSHERTAESEYAAHIQVLKTNKACETICKYPARYKFLKKKLDLNISFKHCDDLNAFLASSNGDESSVVFASSYLESPISYFGHIFIKIDNKNNMFSQTIGYAAEIPQKTGFIQLLTKGITGGFTGKYVANQYFKIIENYGNIEQRALTEYKLNLNSDEVDTIKLHMYEMFGINVPYKFFTENCAYEVLWFLDIARPSLQLTKTHTGIVAPFRVLDAIHEKNIVTNIQKREPQINKMYLVYKSLDSKDKNLFSDIVKSERPIDLLNKQIGISSDTRDKYLYLLNGYYDILFKKYGYSKSDFSEIKSSIYKMPSIEAHESNHTSGSSKIEFTKYLQKNGGSINIQPYLLDKKLDKTSEINEASLKFFETELSRKDGDTKIEKINIAEIESISTYLPFHNQPSWKINIAYDRPLKNDKLTPNAGFGIGKTFEYNDIKAYILGYISVQPIESSANMDLIYGISHWYSDKVHIGFETRNNVAYINKQKREAKELYVVYHFSNIGFMRVHTKEYNGLLFGIGARF